MNKVYLGIGTNLGNKEQNVLRAYELIEHKVGQISKRSSLYSTEPWGFKSDNDFVNSVICVETELSPHDVLKATQAIERQMGRTRKSRGGEYHDRIIDIDILLYDDITVVEPDLIIPHPLMKEREFVMKPLREIIDERL
ncbi:MAG: 2-amino-4-hydroxy-6-hydroxymethyldihydropteridine diphosphokinase [Prevotella sp.]|nr:2-amino-4-hydroxy-6-hydroxymethyldihydropteridine diphosphokinase [Prevotella sp.]